jgi:hypothetical protein
MWSLLLIAAASAVEPASSEVMLASPTILQVDALAQTKKGKKKGKKGGGSEWGQDFYARPSLGASTYTVTGGTPITAVALGGEVGVRYWQRKRSNPIYAGRTRAVAHYIVSSGNATGMEVKLGSFMGPQWLGRGGTYFGLSSGLDVFWNKYEFGDVELDGTLGVGVPVKAFTGVKMVGVFAGFEPAWVDNEERQVNWSKQQAFGFGHQFSTFMGGQVNLGGMSVGVSYTRTITAYGVQQGYGISMNLRG